MKGDMKILNEFLVKNAGIMEAYPEPAVTRPFPETQNSPGTFTALESNGCDYGLVFPELIKSIAFELLQSLNCFDGDYMVIQLVESQCESENLSSLSACFTNCRNDIPVLVFSDSLDISYLKAAFTELPKLFSGGDGSEDLPILNGELAVGKILKRMILQEKLPAHYDNNYIAYHVQNYLKFNSKYRVLRREDDADTRCTCETSVCEIG